MKFNRRDDNRPNYIYHFNDGTVCVITPGEDGVTEVLISMLNQMDHEELNSNRRDAYHCPVHLDAYSDGEGEDADDRNPYLADNTNNPSEVLFKSNEEEEYSRKIDKMNEAISELTEKQRSAIIKRFYNNMSNVDIAAEEGVSDKAIGNRIRRGFRQIKKKIEEK